MKEKKIKEKKVSYTKPNLTAFGSVSDMTKSNKKADVLDNSQENNQVGSNNL